jgi:hypothetical protein
MGDNVKVELTADHAEEGMAGDVVEVHPDRAQTLIKGGVARPAPEPESAKAGAKGKGGG